MTHYAIIKGVRLEKRWLYADNDFMINRMKNYTLSTSEKDNYSPNKVYELFLSKWEESVEKPKLRTYQKENGTYTEWQGTCNLEILGIGFLIYVPSQGKHFKIIKVEANPNGEVTYYVELNKTFDDNLEESRLKAVEDWFKNEYPNFKKFSDLINSRYDQDKYVKEFNDFVKNKTMKLDNTKCEKKSWFERMLG